jgi:S1-C subfamily serine protease
MKEDSDSIENNRPFGPTGPTGPAKELLDRRNIMFAYLGINYIFLCENIIPNIEKKQSNIFQKAIPSVCYISTEYTGMADKYNLNKEDLPKGVGTGFVWDKKGHIVTNFHVINKVDNAIITITDKNNVKKNYKAKLTGIDPDLDIAVLKICICDRKSIWSGSFFYVRYNFG